MPAIEGGLSATKGNPFATRPAPASIFKIRSNVRVEEVRPRWFMSPNGQRFVPGLCVHQDRTVANALITPMKGSFGLMIDRVPERSKIIRISLANS